MDKSLQNLQNGLRCYVQILLYQTAYILSLRYPHYQHLGRLLI